MGVFVDILIETLKGLVGVGASLLPLLGMKLSAFMNPKIIEDVLYVAILVMLAFGIVFYVLARMRPWIWPEIAALGLSIAFLMGLLALTGGILTINPAWDAYLARLLFILFWGFLAGSIAWGVARIIEWGAARLSGSATK